MIELAFGLDAALGVVLVPVVPGVEAADGTELTGPEPVAVPVGPGVLVDPGGTPGVIPVVPVVPVVPVDLVELGPDVAPMGTVELVVDGEPVEPLVVGATAAAAAASCASGANGLRVASPALITPGPAAAGGRKVGVAVGATRGLGRLAAPVEPVLLVEPPPVSIGTTTKNSSATSASAPAPIRASIFGSRALAGAFSV